MRVRSLLTLLLVVAVAGASVLVFSTASSAAGPTTVWVAEDTRVESANPGTNYRNSALRSSWNNSNRAFSYLKFHVPTSPDGSPLLSATLRLYPTTNANNGPTIRTSSSNWLEGSMTWNNKPAVSGDVFADIGAVTAHQWVSADLTDDLVPGTTVTVVLSQSNNVWFRGSEQDKAPRLLVEFGTPPPPSTAPTTAPSGADVVVQVDRGNRVGQSEMELGVTMHRKTLNPSADPAARAHGEDLMRQAAHVQVQPVMGNGVGNPNPAPGVYRWEDLDARIAQIVATGGRPVINMWGAPDWMKQGGQNWQTDWSTIEEPPAPDHYDDFGELARRVAWRYPEVREFIVWNENKGLWNHNLANFDYVEYTRMYNEIYDALKAVDSNIKVGGPYLVVEGTGSNTGTIFTREPLLQRNVDFLTYWIDNAHGADFLAVDRKLAARGDTTTYSRAQEMALTPWFGEVTRRLQEVTDLPVWWVETYFRCYQGSENYMAAGLASMLKHQLESGSVVSLRWAPERQPGESSCIHVADGLQNLWTSAEHSGGAQPLPAFWVYVAFKDNFGPGRHLFEATSSSPNVEALANWYVTLLINKTPNTLEVQLDGEVVTLTPYDVEVVQAN